MTLVNACGKVTAEEVTQVVAKVQEKIHSMKMRRFMTLLQRDKIVRD